MTQVPVTLSRSNDRRQTLNVLIVDRDLTEVRLAERILQGSYDGAYIVRQADCLEQAKVILKAQSMDVVMLDCDTIEARPRKDLNAELRAIDEQVPTVLISGVVDPGYLEMKILADVHRIIDKFRLRDRIMNGPLKQKKFDVKQTA